MNQNIQRSLTMHRATMRIIDEAISQVGGNRSLVLSKVCENLSSRNPNPEKLAQVSQELGLGTTESINHAIDLYLALKELDIA